LEDLDAEVEIGNWEMIRENINISVRNKLNCSGYRTKIKKKKWG
jgi:hypothetical protein